jgi:hypothetical protein
LPIGVSRTTPFGRSRRVFAGIGFRNIRKLKWHINYPITCSINRLEIRASARKNDFDIFWPGPESPAETSLGVVIGDSAFDVSNVEQVQIAGEVIQIEIVREEIVDRRGV